MTNNNDFNSWSKVQELFHNWGERHYSNEQTEMNNTQTNGTEMNNNTQLQHMKTTDKLKKDLKKKVKATKIHKDINRYLRLLKDPN